MLSVKTRKQGNSLTITIPKHFNISIDEEFIPIKKENGTLIFVPIVQDFFNNTEAGEFYDRELVMEYKPVGAENDYD